jgi:hypothetical protein
VFLILGVCVIRGRVPQALARPKRVTVDVGESCSYPLDRPFPQRRVARVTSSTFRLRLLLVASEHVDTELVPSQQLNAQFRGRGRALHGNNATHASQSNGQERTGKFKQDQDLAAGR